ncbi:cysteine synthase A [Companilactobacillus metriopterae]|uniref:cysteine synthase A n=1 Tax=Companilactobacillus metriopterae TaxID=1909267 RepID=UPI00100C0085|nr:cysteine synthase A [Companilactobacillus metriopterae]
MTKVNSITELIGNTPMVKLQNNDPQNMADIFVKLEFFNPGGSVKDRIALSMIEKAEKDGKLKKGDTIVEPTSGNTGIGLSLVASAKGYKIVIFMPETMSVERRKIMQGYGAELVLTPGSEGMSGAIKRTSEYAEENDAFMPMQFENPANPEVHELTTAQEIIKDFKNENIDAFVAGVGTGGTLSGVGHGLKKVYPDVQIYALEASESPLLKEGTTGPHKIQGISAGIIPDTLDQNVYEDIIEVSSTQAIKTAQEVAREEGLLVGISSGANIFGAKEIAKKLGAGKIVVTTAADNGERYLSTDLFNF